MTLLDALEMTRQKLIDAEKCPEWAHEGQRKVWESDATDIVACAGTQGGKTSLTPFWVEREIQRTAPFFKEIGIANILYVGPELTTLQTQAIPQMAELFEDERQYGRLTGESQRPKFRFSRDGAKRLTGLDIDITIHFAYAKDPNNLESMTAGLGVWDEAGQTLNKERSYEAFNRRLKIARSRGFGRRLITTTPYEWGWFKRRIVDRAMRGDVGFSYHNWPSWWNPLFDKKAADDELLNGMEEWRWRMMYLGEWTRPAGAVFPGFSQEENVYDPKKVSSKGCPVFIGWDFGPVNTAFSIGFEQNGILHIAKSIKCHGDDPERHVRSARELLGTEPRWVVGGAKSEDGWRERFQKAGMVVREPKISGPGSYDVGISEINKLVDKRLLKIANTETELIDEFVEMSYELDDSGEPIDKVDGQNSYHRFDSVRYMGTHWADPRPKFTKLASRFK